MKNFSTLDHLPSTLDQKANSARCNLLQSTRSSMELARFSWPGRNELRKTSHEQYNITSTTVNFFSHFKIEIEKATINSIFWTSDPISMAKRRKSLHLFNFYLLFLRKYRFGKGLKSKKPPVDLIFWTSVILSV